MKHSSQCFVTISKTSKFVKNTLLRVVFSTLFMVFDIHVLKHCVSCLIYYLNFNMPYPTRMSIKNQQAGILTSKIYSNYE